MPAGVTAVAAWSLVLGLLVRGLWSVGRDWSKLAPPAKHSDPQIDDWFREAQHEYLKGHWIAAVSLLSRLLAKRPNDVEATLLLASVQRRSRQWDKAKSTLEELSHQPNASRWQFEMAAEQRQINEAGAGAPADQLSGPESTLRSAA
jgi:predicted Zn-dependent protease